MKVDPEAIYLTNTNGIWKELDPKVRSHNLSELSAGTHFLHVMHENRKHVLLAACQQVAE